MGRDVSVMPLVALGEHLMGPGIRLPVEEERSLDTGRQLVCRT